MSNSSLHSDTLKVIVGWVSCNSRMSLHWTSGHLLSTFLLDLGLGVTISGKSVSFYLKPANFYLEEYCVCWPPLLNENWIRITFYSQKKLSKKSVYLWEETPKGFPIHLLCKFSRTSYSDFDVCLLAKRPLLCKSLEINDIQQFQKNHRASLHNGFLQKQF